MVLRLLRVILLIFGLLHYFFFFHLLPLGLYVGVLNLFSSDLP